MTEKVCPNCKELKVKSEFYFQKDRKNGTSYCKSCFNEYCQKRWINKKLKAIQYKGGKCIDCNIANLPYPVYEFHHLEPKEKDLDWTKLRLKSLKAINAELDKCILLCANCHRIRHYKQNLKSSALSN